MAVLGLYTISELYRCQKGNTVPPYVSDFQYTVADGFVIQNPPEEGAWSGCETKWLLFSSAPLPHWLQRFTTNPTSRGNASESSYNGPPVCRLSPTLTTDLDAVEQSQVSGITKRYTRTSTIFPAPCSAAEFCVTALCTADIWCAGSGKSSLQAP